MSKIKIKYLDGKEYTLKNEYVANYVWGDNLSLWYTRPGSMRIKHVTLCDVLYLEITEGQEKTIIINPKHTASIDIMSAKQRAKKNRKVPLKSVKEEVKHDPRYTPKDNEHVIRPAMRPMDSVQHNLDGLGSVLVQNLGDSNVVLEDRYNHFIVKPYGVEIEDKSSDGDELDKLHLIGDWDKPEKPLSFPYKETGSLVQHLCDTIESLQKEIFTLKEGK